MPCCEQPVARAGRPACGSPTCSRLAIFAASAPPGRPAPRPARRRRGGARRPSRRPRTRASRCRPSGCRAGSAAGRPCPCPTALSSQRAGRGAVGRADHGRLLRAAVAGPGGRCRSAARGAPTSGGPAARRSGKTSRPGRAPSAVSGRLRSVGVRGRPAPRVGAHQLRVRVDRHDRPLPAAGGAERQPEQRARGGRPGTKSVRCTREPLRPRQVHLRVARAATVNLRRPARSTVRRCRTRCRRAASAAASTRRPSRPGCASRRPGSARPRCRPRSRASRTRRSVGHRAGSSGEGGGGLGGTRRRRA